MLIEIIGIIPLALPPVTIGFLLLIVLGRNSIIGFPDIHATSSLTRMCSEWEPCDASDWKCFKNRFIQFKNLKLAYFNNF